ncbi:hypothetical protein LINPERHAP2_LOCUS4134 [Linum perenne]
MVSPNNPYPNGNDEIFRFGSDEIQDGLKRSNRSVLIRIFWDQPRNRMFVQNSLNQLWHYVGSIQVLEVGFGLLQVIFPSIDAMKWVLEKRPWSMNMYVMNMVPFSPPSVEIYNELQFMAVWIKLSHVPSHCITTPFGRGFLRYFGDVLDISLFGSRGRDAVFIKGLVRIDLLASFVGRRQACGPETSCFGYVSTMRILPLCATVVDSSDTCLQDVRTRISLLTWSFVTKEKRFGYSAQPNNKGKELEDNELELDTSTDVGRQPTKTKGSKDLKWKNQRIGTGISDG